MNTNIDSENPKWYSYVALLLACIIFSGWLSNVDKWYGCIDFTYLIGDFGKINGSSFVGSGGSGARHAFLFALSLAPGVMLAMGIVAVAEYYGALAAANKILGPLLRPCIGLPGSSGLALISSLQSTDAGAAMTHDLNEKGLLSKTELAIFAMFQFSSGGTIVNYLTTGLALFPYLPISFAKPLLIILICKVIGANVMRLFLKYLSRGKSNATV